MIILDSNCLGHIAKHSMSDELSHEDRKTGVIFGFLRGLLTIVRALKDDNVVFMWDSSRSIRKVTFSEYKSNRKPKSVEEAIQSREAAIQFYNIRTSVLPGWDS